MITDVIVTWPKNCDYPLWRQFIKDNRPKFNEIVIAFHDTHTNDDYSNFVQEAMHGEYVHFVKTPDPRPGEDWRNLAVNGALLHSYNAEWVWFTEEDFYPGEGFWDEVKKHEDEGCEVIAAYQQTRMHPCCIFVKRSVLEKTRRNFGIVPDKTDHFYLFQEDVENMGVKIGKLDPATYYHYNGLSQNWYMASSGDTPNHELSKFVDYLEKCLNVAVPVNQHFKEIAVAVIEKNKPGIEQK